jgi:hypothetical protein
MQTLQFRCLLCSLFCAQQYEAHCQQQLMGSARRRHVAGSAAEWIMWVDIDTIIPDMQVLPRFDEYEGADLVVWGDRAKLMEGNLNEGAQQN